MRKICFILCFISALFAACSSSDGKKETPIDTITQYEQNIIGTWVLVGNKPSKGAEDYTPVENYESSITFNKDRTCRIVTFDNSIPQSPRQSDDKGTYAFLETNKGMTVLFIINGLRSKHIIKFSSDYKILYLLDYEPDGYYASDAKYVKR